MTKLFSLLVLTLLFSTNSLSAQPFWDLNDVTYIMPLPQDADDNNLLSVSTQGLGGEFISQKMIDDMPPLSIRHSREEITSRLRVLAVRIDPCFPLPTPQSCQKQIRFVWQPVATNKQKRVISLDMALHSFYVLNDEQFNSLTNELKNWKKQFQQTEPLTATALDIHPYWKKEKDQSPALLQFNNIIKKYAGLKNLSRVTAMVLRRMDDVWGFLAFDVDSRKNLIALNIPRLKETRSQVFTTDVNNEDVFQDSVMSPLPETTEANLKDFITHSETMTEAELKKSLGLALSIENPKLFNPENMDCVNCHIAQPARQWLSQKKIWDNLAVEYKNSKYDLTNNSTKLLSTKQMRGVGYFEDRLVIAQRVINESAEVADWLNAQLK